jgi:hypothetical protein
MNEMVDAGLLDDLMDRVDRDGLALTGVGRFLPELVKAVLERGRLQAELTEQRRSRFRHDNERHATPPPPRNGGRGVAGNGSENAGGELVEVVSTAAAVAELDDRARRLAKESRAGSTWRANDSDLRHLRTSCAERQLEPLPAEPLTVASDVASLGQTHKPSSISRRLTPISVARQIADLETPTTDAGVRSVWAGRRRRHGTASRKVRAAKTKVVTTIVAPLGDRIADDHDVTDDDGLRIVPRCSKTDQEGVTKTIGLPYGPAPATCPV